MPGWRLPCACRKLPTRISPASKRFEQARGSARRTQLNGERSALIGTGKQVIEVIADQAQAHDNAWCASNSASPTASANGHAVTPDPRPPASAMRHGAAGEAAARRAGRVGCRWQNPWRPAAPKGCSLHAIRVQELQLRESVWGEAPEGDRA